MKLILTRTGTSLVALAALVLGGCGAKTDNPDAVTLENLKSADSLNIADQGNGTIVLSWRGSNYESKFEGYNIYGMAKTDAELTTLGLTKGQPVQLLDGLGQPIEGAKTALAKFNYGDNLNTPVESTAAADADAKLSFLPIHSAKKADGTAVLPTCQPSGTTCVATTEANKKTSGVTNNGAQTYTISGLTVGTQYCFMVFSVLDGGSQIAQTSTNMECVVPRIEVKTTMNPSLGVSAPYDFRDYVSKCTGATCGTFTNGTVGSAATATSEMPLYVEVFGGIVYFTTGKNAAIQDLGYYANGFANASVPKAPVLKQTFDNSTNTVANGGGYAVPGQSLVVKANHVYALAVSNAAADTAPTSFRYHLIYTSDTTDPSSAAAFNVTLRLAVNPDQR